MNKKHKSANKKHRKTKNRLKLLRDASLAKAKKKIINKPKEEPIAKVEKENEDTVVKKSTKKKTVSKKTTQKKTVSKKTTQKKTAAKKTTKKKTAAKK